jgi:hypothetical protein
MSTQSHGGVSVRQVNREELLRYLRRKVGRWDTVWWNGELLSVAEALVRASELPPTTDALCGQDEVLLPAQLEAEVASRVYGSSS